MRGVDAELLIVGWPAQTIEPPPAQRLTFRLERGALVGERMAHELATPPDDACLLLAELDLGDEKAILRFVNDAGVALGDGFEEQPLDEFRRTAVRVRDLVAAWRLLQSEPTLTTDEVEDAEFARSASNGRGVAAAEFLNLTLSVALRSFSPVVWLAHARPETADALREAGRVREVALFPLSCLQLHNHIVTRAEYRRCANETCGRLFAAGEGRRQALYCSAACRHAQAQREFRRRRREATPTT
jgi:hypothetical protein